MQAHKFLIKNKKGGLIMSKSKNNISLFNNNKIIINHNNTYYVKEKESHFTSLLQILSILINLFSLLQS